MFAQPGSGRVSSGSLEMPRNTALLFGRLLLLSGTGRGSMDSWSFLGENSLVMETLTLLLSLAWEKRRGHGVDSAGTFLENTAGAWHLTLPDSCEWAFGVTTRWATASLWASGFSALVGQPKGQVDWSWGFTCQGASRVSRGVHNFSFIFSSDNNYNYLLHVSVSVTIPIILHGLNCWIFITVIKGRHFYWLLSFPNEKLRLERWVSLPGW